MVTATSNSSEHHPLPKKPLQIKQDDKFYSRLVSKENTSSFRVYYGVASGSVPFIWESQPGKPKNSFNDSSLPPLTPPPSYYLNSKKKPNKKRSFSLSKSMFLRLITLKKHHVSPSSLLSLSSSSMSSSTRSHINFLRRSRFSSPRSSFDSNDQDHGHIDSPTSIFCFGVRRNGGKIDADGIRDCYSLVTMKKALLSIIGCGTRGSGGGSTVSAQGTVGKA